MPVFLRRAAAALTVVPLIAPVGASAQTDGVALPPGVTAWEGLVHFAGWVSSETDRGDGSFNVTLTDVIGDTRITFEISLDTQGEITSGTMNVHLEWFAEGVGTSPSTLEPYRVQHFHVQTGVLNVTGNAQRIVAVGEVLWESTTSSEGSEIEEVAQSRATDVEWVFEVTEANCTAASGTLLEAEGSSLMSTVMIPRDTVGEGSAIHNRLTSGFVMFPAGLEDPEIEEALEALYQIADEILTREIPQMENLAELVHVWGQLNAKLAALEGCQAENVGWVPESSNSWLIVRVQLVLGQALESQESYDVAEWIGLWVAGHEIGAMDGELVVGFLDGFNALLDEAIALGDTAAIQDVLAFAAQWGYPGLYGEAKAALEGAP